MHSLGEYRTAARLSTQALALLGCAAGHRPRRAARRSCARTPRSCSAIRSSRSCSRRWTNCCALESAVQPGAKPPWNSRLIAAKVRWQSDMKATPACRPKRSSADMASTAENDPEGFIHAAVHRQDLLACRATDEARSVGRLESHHSRGRAGRAARSTATKCCCSNCVSRAQYAAPPAPQRRGTADDRSDRDGKRAHLRPGFDVRGQRPAHRRRRLQHVVSLPKKRSRRCAKRTRSTRRSTATRRTATSPSSRISSAPPTTTARSTATRR